MASADNISENDHKANETDKASREQGGTEPTPAEAQGRSEEINNNHVQENILPPPYVSYTFFR